MIDDRAHRVVVDTRVPHQHPVDQGTEEEIDRFLDLDVVAEVSGLNTSSNQFGEAATTFVEEEGTEVCSRRRVVGTRADKFGKDRPSGPR